MKKGQLVLKDLEPQLADHTVPDACQQRRDEQQSLASSEWHMEACTFARPQSRNNGVHDKFKRYGKLQPVQIQPLCSFLRW